jgi:hypothetical protein
MSTVRDEFSLEEMCDLRDEFREAIASHASTLCEQVLLRSQDPIALRVAVSMQKLIDKGKSLDAAIRCQVSG